MKIEVSIAPRNSIVLIMDRKIGKIPEAMHNKLVAFTSSCIAIGTLSEYDGKTTISFFDNVNELSLSNFQVFDGVLDTPNKLISICTVLDEPLIECPVLHNSTRIKIWANDKTEPDEIQVIVEDVVRNVSCDLPN